MTRGQWAESVRNSACIIITSNCNKPERASEEDIPENAGYQTYTDVLHDLQQAELKVSALRSHFAEFCGSQFQQNSAIFLWFHSPRHKSL